MTKLEYFVADANCRFFVWPKTFAYEKQSGFKMKLNFKIST